MLVLSRKVGQSVVIGEGTIKVTVLSIRGNTIRLGWEANGAIQIDREEVFLRRQASDDVFNAPPLVDVEDVDVEDYDGAASAAGW